MAEKKSVTVPLTVRQKAQIKRATGKSISALKVGPSGGMVAASRIMKLGTRAAARVAPKASPRMAGKQAMRVGLKASGRYMGRNIV